VSNELIIDVTSSEINIALLEDKQLVELNKEKTNSKFTVGDIYLAKVKKIMSGLNAAFVDVGYERDAFLHYLDLGPQFASQIEFIGRAIKNPQNLPVIQEFKLKPDIDKHGKITELLNSGQHILVQVAKEPISTKGPRVTSEISIAGRNLVLMPFSDKVSISQKIKVKEERDRLRRLITSIKPHNYGVIVRTVAKNRRAAVLDTELKGLVEKWENAVKNLHRYIAPQLVIGELNRASAILRDILNSDFDGIYVNNETVCQEIREYINTIAPEKIKIVKPYSGKVPIFEHFGVDKQIRTLFGKTVTIKNGAYLILESTEALHVIDVNSGNRSKNSTDQETNALDVNLAAAQEIARQLRLRDLGGIIVADFIDLHSNENRKKVFEKMKEAMASDRTKHNILPLSKFGLMQITRQRVRPETNIQNIETCPTCGGSGEISPSIIFVDELESHIKSVVNTYNYKYVILKLHPYIAAYLKQKLVSIRMKWMFKYKIFIKINAVSSFSFLEHQLFDRNGGLLKV
jgi:ribonuclease G